jgi:acyl-CoA synthetase (AMP-forming)/AMP-acid ligase II
MKNTIAQIIDLYAERHPHKTFLITPETGAQLSYAKLQETAGLIDTYLDTLGVGKGEKVAFLLPNGYWSAVLFLGVMYSGRVIVPLNAVAGEAALSYVIEHSDSRLLFVNDELRKEYKTVLDALPAGFPVIETDVDLGPKWPCQPSPSSGSVTVTADDMAILMYTSGTTGLPKGVLLSHRNAIAGGRNTAEAHELTGDDRALCVLPLYHINAQMVTIMAPLVTGSSVVLPHRFSTGAFWQLLAEFDCSWFSVVPTIIAYLLEQAEAKGFDRAALGGLAQLRFGRSASAPLAPEMHKEFENVFAVPIVETMGLTETAAQILSNPMPPQQPKYGSPGRAVGNEAKVIDEKGDECPSGTPGELMIRGDNVTREYYKNPQATAESIDPDGWLHTGDVALQDEDGFFFITGRIKELIIKGGENIAPREIDEALYQHPAVLEAAGFGIPDTRYGQEVMACVALKQGAQCDESELSALLEQHLGSFKSPKRIYFLEDLPKGPSGKIQRLKLTELIERFE